MRISSFLPVCNLAMSAFFFYAWYERFLKWDFNELGRYWDPATETVYTTGGWIRGIPTLLFFATGAFGLYRSIKRKNHRI